MKKPIAHGLALFLSLTGLGATHGPEKQERGISEARLAQIQKSQAALPQGRLAKSRPAAYQVGTASWYGEYFQGRDTASGEPYDMYDLTAAHPTLPLGTFVRVTNLRNGKAVVLKVNDRGPVVEGRIIDVSYSAAQILGMSDRGIQRVRIDLVKPSLHQAAVRNHVALRQVSPS